MSIRICATSDFHGHLPDVPECDLLLVCGDLAGPSDVGSQQRWLEFYFRAWLDALPATSVVVIPGNHDRVFELAPERVPSGLRMTYLQDSGCELFGLKLWGTAWTPHYNNWSFNAPIGDYAEHFLDQRFAMIPDDTDILLTHGPAFGYGDLTASGERAGSKALWHHLRRVRPRLHVFGHIHEAYGAYTIDGIPSHNVSYVDHRYRPGRAVMRFEL